jgi:hypothetical protein
VALVSEAKTRPPSLGVLLLIDIRTVFDEDGRDLLPTAELLTRLNGMETSPWAVIRKGKPLHGDRHKRHK